ncbi:hypothetical protein Tco_0734783 [Tanacetum coccineum]
MHDYRRLSDELTEGVNMRDEYMNELWMLVNYDEILDNIEIMRRMQVNDMEKASCLMVMAREIQIKVHEKNRFILKLRGGEVEIMIGKGRCCCANVDSSIEVVNLMKEEIVIE